MTDYTVIRDGSDENTYQDADGVAHAYKFYYGHGNDTITNFADGEDVIDLSRFPSISEFSDLTITSDADGVTINLSAHGGGTIRLEGFDVANLDASDFLFRVDQTIEGDEGDNTLRGDTGDDTIYGGAGDDHLSGSAGEDTLYGGEGDDGLTGGEGDDSLYGGVGDDDLYGHGGKDALYGGAGSDFLVGGGGKDTIEGGAGFDYLSGGSGNDTLRGGDEDDTLKGGAGGDNLYGDAGDDTLIGGEGDDTLTGDVGDDAFTFGPAHGNDTITDFTDGEDRIDLSGFSAISDFSDLTVTSDGDDAVIDLTAHGGGTIRLEGFDASNLDTADFLFKPIEGDNGDNTLTGGAGDDTIWGGHLGDDTIDGVAGDDTIYGGAGDDCIDGGEGDDALYGGAGDDYIDGGGDDDTLTGDAGADNFVIGYDQGNDTITDFTGGEDRIDLSWLYEISGFDDLTITAEGNDAVIDLTAHGSGTIRLENVAVANLDAEDFTFYDSSVDEGGVDAM